MPNRRACTCLGERRSHSLFESFSRQNLRRERPGWAMPHCYRPVGDAPGVMSARCRCVVARTIATTVYAAVLPGGVMQTLRVSSDARTGASAARILRLDRALVKSEVKAFVWRVFSTTQNKC